MVQYHRYKKDICEDEIHKANKPFAIKKSLWNEIGEENEHNNPSGNNL